MRLTLLGTGNAGQVPVYNCDCASCARAREQTQYRRGPCCALLEHDEQRWLIDSGLTDLAERFEPHSLSGILQTHYHADHAQGLLHLRWGKGLRIPVLGPPDLEGFADLYKHPGILDFSTTLNAFESTQHGSIVLTPVPLAHSRPTYGYVFSDKLHRLAYLTDTAGLPAQTHDYLRTQSLDLLVLDCSHAPQAQAPRNHNDWTRALETVAQLRPKKAVLTHIGHELDTWVMANADALPDQVTLGMDGQIYSTD